MSASKKLAVLLQEADENDDVPLPAAEIVAVVEKIESAGPFLLPGQRQNMHGGQMVPAMFLAMTPEEWEAILEALAALDEALT